MEMPRDHRRGVDGRRERDRSLTFNQCLRQHVHVDVIPDATAFIPALFVAQNFALGQGECTQGRMGRSGVWTR